MGVIFLGVCRNHVVYGKPSAVRVNSLDSNAAAAKREDTAYKTFVDLCNGSKHGRGGNPAMLLSINELGDKLYAINRTKPYYIAAQIANIQHLAEGKGTKELSTEKAAQHKTSSGKQNMPGGSRAPGNSKEVIEYNWMVVFRYYVTVLETSMNIERE
jgi:hypothetical protein